MNLPENMINYAVYLDGSRLMGTASVDLPSLDQITQKITGAGIGGEVEAPVMGHFAAMTLGVSWRTITKEAMILAQPAAHSLEFRGSQQVYDTASGLYSTVPVKVIVKASPKKTGLGKMVVAAQTDTKNEFEVSYIKVYFNGEEQIEIDKYNFIARIQGTDYLAAVRNDLGI